MTTTFQTTRKAPGMAAPRHATKPLNLLFFGNSFTIGNGPQNVPQNVANLATTAGLPAPLVVADLEAGQNLDYHISRVDSVPQYSVNHPSIAGKTWDFVILQGFSTEPTHIGDPDGFRADAVSLVRRIREHASGHGALATAILFQTWARQAGHSCYPAIFSRPAAMQSELRSGYRAAHDDINVQDLAAGRPATARIAPVGDAFEKLGFDRSLYDVDLHHANVKGSLLASMVIYRTIYGQTIGAIRYAATSAWVAVDEPTWNSLAATADSLVFSESQCFG